MPGAFIPSPTGLGGAGIGADQSIASPFVEQNHDVMETLAGEFNTGSLAHKLVLIMEQDWFITNHDTFTTTYGDNALGSAWWRREILPVHLRRLLLGAGHA